MRFFRRAEILLDTQVNLHAAALEPAASAFGELGRLRDFGHSQDARIKPARGSLFARRHGQLYVIDGEKGWNHRRLPAQRKPTNPLTDWTSLAES